MRNNFTKLVLAFFVIAVGPTLCPAQEHKTFMEHGVVFLEGDVVDGKRDGLWNEYYEDGSIRGEVEYIHGIVLRYRSFYPNGQLAEEGLENPGDFKAYLDDGSLLLAEMMPMADADISRQDSVYIDFKEFPSATRFNELKQLLSFTDVYYSNYALKIIGITFKDADKEVPVTMAELLKKENDVAIATPCYRGYIDFMSGIEVTGAY